MKNAIKKIFMGLCGFALAASMSCGLARSDSSNVQIGYNTRAKALTTRIESNGELSDRLSYYGFLDADATQESPADLESFYGELRLMTPVTDALCLAAEYNGGNSMEDLVRLGVGYSPRLGENNFTFLKFYPVETSGKKGMQFSVYSRQKLGSRLNASLWADWDISQSMLLCEPELEYRLGNGLIGYTRAKGVVGDKFSFTPIVGCKYEFH